MAEITPVLIDPEIEKNQHPALLQLFCSKRQHIVPFGATQLLESQSFLAMRADHLNMVRDVAGNSGNIMRGGCRESQIDTVLRKDSLMKRSAGRIWKHPGDPPVIARNVGLIVYQTKKLAEVVFRQVGVNDLNRSAGNQAPCKFQ